MEEATVPDDTAAPNETLEPVHHRLTDTQALGGLGAWLVFRQITARLGIAAVPRLARKSAWMIPFLTNASPQLIIAGTGIGSRWGMFAATIVTSVVMSTITGLIFYWAAWRFGHRLAEMSKRPGSPWAALWNPKQIARAERWMDSWGILVVFFGRATEHFTLPITLVAGASEMRFRRFIIAHVGGAIAFAAGFLTIGHLAEERWPWLSGWIAHTYAPWALRIGLASIGLLVNFFALGHFVQNDDEEKKEDEEKLEEPQGDSTITPSQGSSEIPPETS